MPLLLFLLLTSTPLLADLAWPPPNNQCDDWRNTAVLNQASCPSNQTVFVSRNGGSGDISFEDFWSRLGTEDNITYILRKDPSPYIVGCRQVNIGGWGLSQKRTCITVRGETGIREDVVLAGADPAQDPDFWRSSEYNGPSSCGIGQVIQIVNAENIVFADLTMRNFAGKMLKVDGGTEGSTPWFPRNIRFHNLELHDCGSQMIKGAGDPIGSMNGVLECSYLHYTDGLFAESSYETQGIDIHEGKNWVIRDNHFENFRQHPNKPGLGSAILMWDRTDTVLAERNFIENCNFAIKFGATWYDDECDWMTAKNNLIVYDDTSSQWKGDNAIEIGQSMTHGGVFHNTIWNTFQDPATALAVCSNSYPIRNNLYVLGTQHRCASLADNLVANASWFVDVPDHDFHLTQARTVPAVAEVTHDMEGDLRATSPSAGAYAFGSPQLQDSPSLLRYTPQPMQNGIEIFDIRGLRRFHAMGEASLGHLVPTLPNGLYIVKNGQHSDLVPVTR